MSDADDLSLVERLLGSAGLRVERVPTAQTRRCDLRADDTLERYLIEVKGFHDDEAINKNLRNGKLYERSRSFDFSNTIDAAIGEAVQQLKGTLDQRTPELRVLCLLCRDKYDADLTARQIRAVLYGMRSLVHSAGIGKVDHRECLYFAESAFYRHRDSLDAAIVVDAEGAIICVNDHGGSVDRVRKSALGRFFVEQEAFYDAGTWERQGWLVADCNFDRSDEQKVRLYVEQKYGLGQTTLMGFRRYGAMVSVTDSREALKTQRDANR